MSDFIDVDIEPCAASPDGLSMRWKQSAPPREIVVVDYESEEGLAGTWAVVSGIYQVVTAFELRKLPQRVGASSETSLR